MVIDTEFGNDSCPECRTPCSPRDLQQVNFKLANIVQYYKSLQEHESTKKVSCTYCIQSSVTAVKTCLHCQASYCKEHLEFHRKGKEHVLVDPTASQRSRKCIIHDEVLTYFCIKDQTCICTSCSVVGEHQDHQTEVLQKASLSKKEQLKKLLESLKLEQEFFKGRAKVLLGVLKQTQEKVVMLKNDIQVMYSELRECVVDAHVSVMSEVRIHMGQVSNQISGEISSVQKRAAKLSQDIGHLQTACSKMDPFLILQDKVWSAFRAEPDAAPPVLGLDMLLIGLISQRTIERLSDHLPQLSSLLVRLHYEANLLLNEATASRFLTLSADLKTVKYSRKKLCREPMPSRFETSQVLSISSFSSGKYFWEVRTSHTGVKAVGVAYPTIERRGLKAFLGYNEKSWCLIWEKDCIEVCHNSDCKQIVSNDSSMSAVGVFLDYEAGQLSFYRLCSQVEHLHTITAKFSEPLHSAFYVVDGWIKINSKKQCK
ncbi:tripartite motif-containing protein 16-like [Bufo gargarizans]|uniref:tripartite motif-containing protein 16-like n=1 Tax=Bufo gargarizans TaxID=30331 RepID=UPI001CF0F66A|nr:tripartite motif-containing protein 16-like [Bufo gargarizans]